MSTAPPLFDLSHIYKRFGSNVALRDINFEVRAGDSIAVLGPNGAGKTTLLRTLATLSRPTRGRITAFGVDAWTAKPEVRSRIGFVAHAPYIYPELTCLENLVFFGTMYDQSNPQLKAAEALERVGLAPRSTERASTLSRGLLQRLNLARAILHDPPVLILDEPDTGLDAAGRAVLSEIIRSQVARGGSVVMTTHAIDYGLGTASRIVLLVDGQVVLDESHDIVDGTLVEAMIGRDALLAGR